MATKIPVIFMTLLLAFTLGCHNAPKVASAPLGFQPSVEQQHLTTHRIGVYKQFEGDPKHNFGEAGHCSGTAVGHNAILTAQHCFHGNMIRLDADSKPTIIIATLIDGNDHIIYLVDHEFTAWANILQRDLIDGEHVHIWGAPGDNTDVYRLGYYVWLAPYPDIDKHFMFQNFVLPVFRGDSGAGIFDEQGNVVAVTSYADESANELSEPLQFTDAQLWIVETP